LRCDAEQILKSSRVLSRVYNAATPNDDARVHNIIHVCIVIRAHVRTQKRCRDFFFIDRKNYPVRMTYGRPLKACVPKVKSPYNGLFIFFLVVSEVQLKNYFPSKVNWKDTPLCLQHKF
jgi:hypothetical protein